MLSKCCTQCASKFGKPSCGHRTGKGQFSSHFPRRAVLKNVQTTGQLYSSPRLLRLCSKSSKLGFSITWTEKFQTFKLGLEKAEKLQSKLLTFAGSYKAREFQKNIYLCFIDYTKTFDCVDHNKLWKTLKEMGISDDLTSFPEKLVCR